MNKTWSHPLFPWGISPCMWGEEEAKTPNCELSSYVGVSMSDGRTQSKQGPTDFHFTSSRLHFGPERIVALLLCLLVSIILRLLVSIILHLLVPMILHWTILQCSDLNNTHSYILYIIYCTVDYTNSVTMHCTRAQTASSHLLLRALILPIGAISTRLHTAYLSILDDFKPTRSAE